MMVVFGILLLLLVLAVVRMICRPRILTFFTVVFLLLVFLVLLGPLTNRIDVAERSAAMQTSRTIALAEFQYANDNGGAYPEGNSSTEVFQKLLDGNYVSDPSMFYLPIAGKTRPTSSRLKPENVGYDVTAGIRGSAPRGLPLVFVTGYKIDYHHGGAATPASRPRPSFLGVRRTWWEWIDFKPDIVFVPPIFCASTPLNAENSVQDLDFDPSGKAYRQLTPDGPL